MLSARAASESLVDADRTLGCGLARIRPDRLRHHGTGTTHGFAVTDGDTVKFGRQRVRMFGIDAPEKGQTCDGGKWHPGPLATAALVRFIAGRPVAYQQIDYDGKNGRPVAELEVQEAVLGGGSEPMPVEVANITTSTSMATIDQPIA